ncbi:2-amino-4-hydroxy-6-hydroxymethyldihydropteridine diphosphokinase [Moraxella nasibovis]|uniref:2-amino-4-hydroxy-6- hydroxymethyldihydropteridine diphosphokinase n=1 Tax=Moraxella nasibovis TaxID=2904120 RepID=UPI00240F2E18|nr:2-amino-4-hydroxy-6-hydroxymethyldihydropteridine diphosphokinase [Moraxella nasibovis]WFF38581.1 2-amino-4-hydroxy-6-hydroxymethyldihydropteridine diphosphokinase [Moraxella nasibovis]
MKTVYIGLGGNIANEHGTPKAHLQNAVSAFQESAHFKNVAVSSFYSSKAYGVTDQPDFINAVLKADTDLAPIELLDFCQSLENHAGRVRLRHWGERCLDVDVLLYGDKNIENERLTVPHKELTLRNFVVIPMLELDHDLAVNGQPLKELVAASDWGGLELL